MESIGGAIEVAVKHWKLVLRVLRDCKDAYD
jgi:hypothetical protein